MDFESKSMPSDTPLEILLSRGKKICHDGIGIDANISDALTAPFHILLEATVILPTYL